MNILRKNYVIALFLLILFCFSSCRKEQNSGSLNREELFSLSYGMFEDELRMFDVGKTGHITTSLYMENGFFYIANNEAQKILLLSSYGDLLQIVYNAAFNPTPSFVTEDSSSPVVSAEESVSPEIVTQKAVVYPFTNLGCVTSDTQKNMYAVDFLPPERYKIGDDDSLLRQVVLRFSSDATFIDYLGQEGPGGTPFPYIDELYTTKNDELVVICKNNTGFLAFWFSPEGFLKYRLPIAFSVLPEIETDEKVEQFPSLTEVIPDSISKKLYLKIDYYVSVIDEQSKVQSGIHLKQTNLYPLDVATGVYGEPLVIPPYESVQNEGYAKNVHLLGYDFLGVTDSGWFFFMIGDQTGYSVLMVQPNGQRIISRHLDVDPHAVLFQDFSLSRSGIISALLVYEDDSRVCWWRTDEIIASFLR